MVLIAYLVTSLCEAAIHNSSFLYTMQAVVTCAQANLFMILELIVDV